MQTTARTVLLAALLAGAAAAAPAPQPVCFQYIDTLNAVASVDASLGTTSRASWRLPFDFTFLYGAALSAADGTVWTCGSRTGSGLSLVGQDLSDGHSLLDAPVHGEPFNSLVAAPGGALYALQQNRGVCPPDTASICFVQIDRATGVATRMPSGPKTLTGRSCVPLQYNGVYAYGRGAVAPDGSYVTLWQCDPADLVEVRVRPGQLGSSSRVIKGANASKVLDFWVRPDDGRLFLHRDDGLAGHTVHEVLASGALSPRVALRVANVGKHDYVNLAPVRGGFCLAVTPRAGNPVTATLSCSYGAVDGAEPQFVTSFVSWPSTGVLPAGAISDAVPC